MNYKRLAVLTVLLMLMSVPSVFCENLSYYAELDPGEHFQRTFPTTIYPSATAKTHYDATELSGSFTLTTEVSVDGETVVENSHNLATDQWYYHQNADISLGYLWAEYTNVYGASGTLYYDFIW